MKTHCTKKLAKLEKQLEAASQKLDVADQKVKQAVKARNDCKEAWFSRMRAIRREKLCQLIGKPVMLFQGVTTRPDLEKTGGTLVEVRIKKCSIDFGEHGVLNCKTDWVIVPGVDEMLISTGGAQ